MAIAPFVFNEVLTSPRLNEMVDAINLFEASSGTVTLIETKGLATGGPINSTGTITVAAPAAGVVLSDGSALLSATLGTGLQLSGTTLSNTGVTSVSIAAPGIFTPSGAVTSTGTLTLTPVGTSGGVPYFSSSSTMASSGALAANRIVLGGGAGAAPTSLGAGTATQVLHGNASGAPTFSAVSLTADVTGTLPVANGGTGGTALSAVFVGRKGSITYPLAANGAALTANTFTIVLKAPVAFTVNSVFAQTGAGSFTANIRINSTSITGMSALTVNTTPTLTNAGGANTVAVNDTISIIVTSPTGSPTDAVIHLDITYT